MAILAEAPAQPPAGAGESGIWGFITLLGPMLVVFIVINHLLISRPQKKEQQRHQEMLASLKKNSRVVTAGGIVGTFVSISEDKREVTLRVDDNTRIKFRSESIRGVLDESGTEAGDGAKTT